MLPRFPITVADLQEGEECRHYGRSHVHVVCEEEKSNWLGIEDHHVSFAGERASSFFLRALDVIRQSAPSRKDLTVDLEFTGPR
jgi:hypothetical protein